jgi:hypothetical protein
MISDHELQLWFRGELDASSSIDMTNDVAYPNRSFDSSGKALWYAERYQVADEGPAGNEENLKSGLIFYDVFVPRGSGDDTANAAAEAIADIFEPSLRKEQQVDSTTKLDIDVATTAPGFPVEDTEYQIPVRIEFRAYEVTT